MSEHTAHQVRAAHGQHTTHGIWSILTRVEDLSEEESAQRVAQCAKQQEG